MLLGISTLSIFIIYFFCGGFHFLSSNQENNIKKYSDYNSIRSDDLLGGNYQKWKKSIIDIGLKYSIENLPDGINMEDYLELILKKYHRSEFPIVLNPKISTFDDVAVHGILRQRLGKNTVAKHIRYAKFMETHIIPVDFRNPNKENFFKHMDYREQYEFTDGKGYSALSHEWRAMKMFLRAYGMEKWDYKPPSFPLYKAKIVPFPEQVSKILQLKYSKDDYENALIKYILTHNFIVGWRIPSEPFMMKVSDIFINDNRGFIKITEPKKHQSTRTITPTEIIIDKHRKSFKNWIDYWRIKVENQYSGDALYLRPNGKAFSNKEQLRMFLERKAKPLIKTVFPEYHNYIARDFCAISRLIRTKLESNHFDIYEVKEWLGHTQIQNTIVYLKDAKKYFKIAPYDWINRTLRTKSGESVKNSRSPKNRCS